MLTALLFGLPAVYAAIWIVLLIRSRRAGLLVSLVMCVLTLGVGYWSIRQSRSSTAGIGFLFLPGLAAVSGGLGLLFGRLRRRPRPASQVVAWLCLLASIGLTGWPGVDGIRERTKNDARDRQQAEISRAIDQNRARIARIVQDHAGSEAAALDAEIEKHAADRTFLIPVLETSFVSEDTLDRLASNGDVGVVLGVARNPRTRPDTLARIYRTSSYPPYFFQPLAENKNTPVDILRTLFTHPEPLMTLDGALARNPSTPHDVLDKIAGSGDAFALRNLLDNAALDCVLLRKVAVRLSPADRRNVRVSDAAIGSLEGRLCVPQ